MHIGLVKAKVPKCEQIISWNPRPISCDLSSPPVNRSLPFEVEFSTNFWVSSTCIPSRPLSPAPYPSELENATAMTDPPSSTCPHPPPYPCRGRV